MNKTVLVILDGVGETSKTPGNAVSLAKMKNFERIKKESLTRLINASGHEVGLVSGKDAGNSEVGHNAIGSGQYIKQNLALVDEQIDTKQIFKTQIWQKLCENSFKNNKKMHFIGLLSDGRVHSDIRHLFEMLISAKELKVKNIYIHALLDGRDVAPQSAPTYLKMLEDFILKNKINAKIATVGGRNELVMDRYDSRKFIVTEAFNVYVEGKAQKSQDIYKTISDIYKEKPNITDESIKPYILNENGLIENGDSVVLFNFRGDRAIEISEMFDKGKYHPDAKTKLNNCIYAGLLQYEPEKNLPKNFLSAPPKISDTLTEWLIKKNITQFTVTESYKFGHLSYYFNGNRREAFDSNLETYTEVKSDISPIETQPKMKAEEICSEVLKAIESDKYTFIKTNFPNGDMVGHTGDLNAVITGLKAVDKYLGAIYNLCKKNKVNIIITSDHGNAEEMLDDKGERNTKHTANKVFVCIKSYDKNYKLKSGEFGLTNLASTICNLIGVEPNKKFNQSLIESI